MEGHPPPPPPPRSPGPGWYPAPNDPTNQRYWDGQRWSGSYAPARPLASGEQEGSLVLIVVGYLAAVVMPLIGFILGVVMVVRGRKGETLSGLIAMFLSIAAVIAYLSIIANQAGK